MLSIFFAILENNRSTICFSFFISENRSLAEPENSGVQRIECSSRGSSKIFYVVREVEHPRTHWKILSQLTVPGHSISKGIVYKILTTKILTFNLMSIYAYRGEVPLSWSFHRNRAFRLSTQMLVRLWRNQMKQKLL